MGSVCNAIRPWVMPRSNRSLRMPRRQLAPSMPPISDPKWRSGWKGLTSDQPLSSWTAQRLFPSVVVANRAVVRFHSQQNLTNVSAHRAFVEASWRASIGLLHRTVERSTVRRSMLTRKHPRQFGLVLKQRPKLKRCHTWTNHPFAYLLCIYIYI